MNDDDDDDDDDNARVESSVKEKPSGKESSSDLHDAGVKFNS